jgi:sugar/nucleoside kinase (ribokinase family)
MEQNGSSSQALNCNEAIVWHYRGAGQQARENLDLRTDHLAALMYEHTSPLRLEQVVLRPSSKFRNRTAQSLASSIIYSENMAKMPKVDLVGVGLNATDTLIPLAIYPALGSKVEYQTATVLPGGQVATASVACARWGLQTRYVGKLGDDSAADLHRQAFAEAGVEAQLITVAGGASPQSLILVDGAGERTVLCRKDERLVLQPGDLNREWVIHARSLLVDGHDTAAATLSARWARSAGIPVIADLDELYPGVEELLENVDYAIVSRDFPCRLTGEVDLEKALRRIQRRYKCRLTAATLGPDGVIAWDGKQFYHTPAYCVSVVDTTGAGDIFHAGFIYGLLQNWPLERQLDFACAAAALNCMASGARGGIQSVEAIKNLMKTGTRYYTAYSVPVVDSVAG